MHHHDETTLDDLLRTTAPQPLPHHEQEQVFADTWHTLTTTLSGASSSTAGTAAGVDAGVELATRRARRLDVVAAQQVRARRHRRLARISAITLTVVVAGAGTAAAATYLATRTGQHTSGWQANAAGPGEVLRQDGSDYLDVAAALTADIPFPADHQTQRRAQFRTGSLAPEPGAQITVSTLRAQVAQNAICTWADAWIAADATGHTTAGVPTDVPTDVAARQAATDALTASLTWPAVTDVDPTPSATGAPGDAGAETETRFGWVPAIATAAAGGNREAVLEAVTDSGRCSSPGLAPAITATTAATTGQGRTR